MLISLVLFHFILVLEVKPDKTVGKIYLFILSVYITWLMKDI